MKTFVLLLLVIFFLAIGFAEPNPLPTTPAPDKNGINYYMMGEAVPGIEKGPKTKDVYWEAVIEVEQLLGETVTIGASVPVSVIQTMNSQRASPLNYAFFGQLEEISFSGQDPRDEISSFGISVTGHGVNHAGMLFKEDEWRPTCPGAVCESMGEISDHKAAVSPSMTSLLMMDVHLGTVHAPPDSILPTDMMKYKLRVRIERSHPTADPMLFFLLLGASFLFFCTFVTIGVTVALYKKHKKRVEQRKEKKEQRKLKKQLKKDEDHKKKKEKKLKNKHNKKDEAAEPLLSVITEPVQPQVQYVPVYIPVPQQMPHQALYPQQMPHQSLYPQMSYVQQPPEPHQPTYIPLQNLNN